MSQYWANVKIGLQKIWQYLQAHKRIRIAALILAPLLVVCLCCTLIELVTPSRPSISTSTPTRAASLIPTDIPLPTADRSTAIILASDTSTPPPTATLIPTVPASSTPVPTLAPTATRASTATFAPTFTRTSRPKSPPPSPTVSGFDPSKPTALCKDGTYSYSKHRSGTCSGHGGVKQWLQDPPG